MPPAPRSPLRPLFVNQGAVGSTVLGHLATERALRLGLSRLTDVEATFVRLPQWSRPERLVSHRVPRLAPLDLDLHQLRWHLAESYRGRRTIASSLAAAPADVLHVNTHTAALTLGDIPARVPTFLAVDVPMSEWYDMSSASRGPRAAVAMAASLRLERRAFERASAVLAYSDWAAEAVRRACPTARVVTLHPGVDLERFTPAPREPRVRPRVLFVGGRFAQKGGDDLLAALEGQLGRTVDLDVVTAEPPEPRPGLTVHRLTGDDPALTCLFQQADLVCLPSYVDAVPWTVLEAMACGTPVVATAVGAVPGMLGSGGGATVPPGDVRALRGALEAVLGDPAGRNAMGTHGRAAARADFDVHRQGAKLAELFRAAAERRAVADAAD